MSGELTPAGGGGAAVPPSRLPALAPGGAAPGGWSPPPPRPTPDDEIDLREVWAILRRNWWIVAGCTALGLLAALAYVKLATPIYRSSTTLQFQEKGSTVPVLDALRDLQGGTEVGTEMEVLRSRSLAEAVIDSLGLQVAVRGPRGVRRADALAAVQADADAPEGRVRLVRGEDGRFTAELVEGEATGELGAAAPGEPLRLPGATVVLAPAAAELDRIELEILPRTLAAERFGEALGVSRPNRDANMVQARFDAPDPELARDVANVLAHQYLVRRNAVRKVGDRSTVEFLRSQVDTLQVQLRTAEDAVRRFREQNRVVSLEAEAQAQVERLAALQAQRAELEAEREALAALLADAQAAAGPVGQGPSPYRRLLAFPTLLRNQTTSTLLQALTARETELSQLRARRTPADPDVQAVAGQLASLEEQATAVVTTYLGGLANQVEAIDRELAGFGVRLSQVPAKEVEYARLERSARVLADIYTLLQTRLKEAEVVEAVEDASVRVVDVAVVADEQSRPRPLLSLFLSGLLGLAVGGGLVVVRSGIDTAVHSREDIADLTRLPVLGAIPGSPIPFLPDTLLGAGGGLSVAPGTDRSARRWQEMDHIVGEAYRTLRTNLAFGTSANGHRVIAVTSAVPGEGKTTVAANLAAVFAQQRLRVLLIDADLRRGQLHKHLDVPLRPGLTDVLQGKNAIREAIRVLGEKDGPMLHFLTKGTFVPNPSEMLAEGTIFELTERATEEFDVIIFDCAPLNLVTDAALVGRMATDVLVVTRVGKSDRHQLRLLSEQLQRLGLPVTGVVVTGESTGTGARYAGYYGTEAE